MNEPVTPARSLSAGEKRAAYLCAAWVVVVGYMLLAASAFWIAEGVIDSAWVHQVANLLFDALFYIGFYGAGAWALYLGYVVLKEEREEGAVHG
jgi:uncharacterized membrane protein